MTKEEENNIPVEPVKEPEIPEKVEQPKIDNEAEVVETTKEDFNKLVEDLATERQSRINLQGEIKDLRSRKEGEEPKSEPTDVEKLVDAKFQERKQEEVKANQDTALNKFFKEHPEFDTTNDVGGVLFDKFQKTLARLNITSAASVEDFESAFGDTLNLMGYKTDDEAGVPSRIASTPNSKSATESKVATKLEGAEARLVEQHYKGDVETYLKQKAKRPDYFATLLEYAK